MRFLAYLLMFLLMGTAVAQSPTILQGSYISNVFGNSNFILNPNAQTSTQNVLTSSASVSRNTSTPLVANTEFLITTSANNGYVEWNTRAFDQGMKYQVCEARFIYRGFSTGTTTAQVVSGVSATVIASQVLTASTDARTVSILFNCGDLTQTTKFRLQQSTANLTGINEIGGIYLGLATNLSNVAQATKIGGFDNVSCSAEAQLTTGVGWFAPNIAGTCIGTAVGSASAALSNLNTFTFTFTGLPPGEYLLLMPAYVYTSVAQYARCDGRIRETTLNYVDGQNAFSSYQTAPTSQFGSIGQINQFKFTNTVTANRTFQIEFNRISQNSNCLGGFITQSGAASHQNISLYRFPSASEQVVTPNITSTWGGVRYSSPTADILSYSAVTDVIANSTNWGSPTLLGKAQVSSSTCGLTTNDIGFCLQNVPPGTYEISTAVQLAATWAGASAGINWCSASISVSGTSLSTTRTSNTSSYATVSGGEDYSTLNTGVVKIDSFQANLAVVLRLSKPNSTGTCYLRGNTGADRYALPQITFKPIDYQLPLPVFIDQTPYTVTATSLTAPVAPYGRFEASGAGTTITLFGCTAATKGYNVEVKRVDASNNITVSRSGTDTIDGATTDVLAVNFQATQYVCNGSGGWRRF